MSGHRSWEEVKKELGLENYVPKHTKLEKLRPGKYWKSWTKKEKENRSGKDWRLHKKQRVEFGYSTFDWWSMDSYIAGVIAHACDKFAKESHGHPGDMTYEEWQNYCSGIAAPLKLWASANRWKLSHEDEMKLYEEVKEAMHLFAERFGCFWD